MDSFFGIGLFELMLIAIIALVVLGPERLPAAMREVAKYMRQLREISGEFQSQFSEELKMLDEINPKRIIDDAIKPPPAKPATQQPLKPATQPPKPAVKTQPASPAVSSETGNSILPAPLAAPSAAPGQAGMAQNSAGSPPDEPTPETTTASPEHDDTHMAPAAETLQ